MAAGLPCGRRTLDIETEIFRVRDYQRFLEENRSAIESFQSRRQAAFETEREEWARRGGLTVEPALPDTSLLAETTQIPQGTEPIEAPLGGNVWRVHVRPGDVIQKGSVIAVIEAMKTECEVPSPHTGIVRAVYIRERQHVRPGTPIIALELSTRAPSGGG